MINYEYIIDSIMDGRTVGISYIILQKYEYMWRQLFHLLTRDYCIHIDDITHREVSLMWYGIIAYSSSGSRVGCVGCVGCKKCGAEGYTS